MSNNNGWQAPEIPNKYDIIPIHSSDRAAFRRCRRFWDWSSPTRTNLTVRADIHGVSIPLFFGTGIHYALEQYYIPTESGIKRDPVEAFQTWFDIMWRGGIVTEDWLDKVYDLKPVPNTHAYIDDINFEGEIVPMYMVRGLEDILPDPDHNEWDDLRDLGVNMMKYYKTYAEINDNFEVVVAEHQFSVPIWDYEKDCVMERRDLREESPNFGELLEVHSRGKQDAIYVKPNGKLGILENKTSARWGEEELRKLENDEQCTNYIMAAEIEAKYYDLPHRDQQIEEVTYNVLRKTYPKPPTQLKNGMFSTAITTESTTYELLQEFIARHMPGVPLTEKQQGYLSYLRDVGAENFIVRKQVRRNKHQIANAAKRLFLESKDMLQNPNIYPNISNDWMCLNCSFRAPCLAKEDGSDYKQLIADNYTTNKNR